MSIFFSFPTAFIGKSNGLAWPRNNGIASLTVASVCKKHSAYVECVCFSKGPFKLGDVPGQALSDSDTLCLELGRCLFISADLAKMSLALTNIKSLVARATWWFFHCRKSANAGEFENLNLYHSEP